jgi:Na+/H+ antiporter NhaD/arsenite permease-like protein
MISAFIIPIVLLIIIFSILTGKINQFVIGLGGVILVIISLAYFDNVSFLQIIYLLAGQNNFENLHTILFFFGLIIMSSVAERAGVYTYIAFKLVKRFGSNSKNLLYVLCTTTFLFSALLSNVLCIFLIIPLTITICRIIRVNPIPYIIAQAMVINLGGLLFVISSVPNLLIGQSIGWSFQEYFIDMGFFSIIMFILTLLFLNTYSKFKLEKSSENLLNILKNYDAWIFVEDKRTFYICSAILVGTLSTLIILPIFVNIYLEIITLMGGFLSVISTKEGRSKKALKNLNITPVFYLTFILFISEALVFTDVLNFVIDGLRMISFGNTFLLTILILWVVSLMSAVLNNAPVTNIWIPLVDQLATPSNVKNLYSALSIGAVLGENMGPMGDNLTLISTTRQYGYEIKYAQFVEIGILATTLQLICATIFLMIKTHVVLIFFGVIILIGIFIIILRLHEVYTWLKEAKPNVLAQYKLLKFLIKTQKAKAFPLYLKRLIKKLVYSFVSDVEK